MVKATYVDKNGVRKGAWTQEEDHKLRSYVEQHGNSNWRLLPKSAGLDRCGKSCRLRWMNYLKPGVRRGDFSQEERDLIAKLHHQHGNKWSAIAAELPGRTDHGIKNYWHAHHKSRKNRISRKSSAKLDKGKGVLSPVFVLESSHDPLLLPIPSCSDADADAHFSQSHHTFWTHPFLLDDTHDYDFMLYHRHHQPPFSPLFHHIDDHIYASL